MDIVDLTAERERLRLAPDCANCFGLCCVAHGFRASTFFAFDKLPGVPCPNLQSDFGCAVYGTLRPKGFAGCTAYTCYGAGQRVSQEMFGGTDWRRAPGTAEVMFQTLPMVRQLHELLWFVTEALARCGPGADHTKLLDLRDETERLATLRASEMSWGDVDHHSLMGESLLRRVSASVRATASPVRNEGALHATSSRPPRGVQPEPATPVVSMRSSDVQDSTVRGAQVHEADLPGVDLRGADLRGADLRRADLRRADLCRADLWGAVLVQADLSGADLRWADLMGADLSRANLVGADLSGAIFLTQSQLELADGDPGTTLSAPLLCPAHWTS